MEMLQRTLITATGVLFREHRRGIPSTLRTYRRTARFHLQQLHVKSPWVANGMRMRNNDSKRLDQPTIDPSIQNAPDCAEKETTT
ncbi:hypothetical protein [Comamonas sp. 17RB]|uniref:hypothetical protein n=1 Tax=Comamonas sp. 17RB TaxID=3047025 RepID=UPI0024B6882E|nr:hypothetical protein [Comamonas sp. 17RB]MDI9855572.1 hypothetical protein [Comamonas sp. 17RB]